ncbi:MAG: UDP-2,3-diacylglucosamine diphosphatase LpxI [Myxococcota bacterium]|nr:UDP-2,3-diacylglucosamine diphosphatase LpxI [Myxococcota bacterium]
MERIGLIAGNGRLPFLIAEAARRKGLTVCCVAHRGETDPALEALCDHFAWVRLGQVNRVLRTLRGWSVQRAMMAGGLGKVRAFTEARPDLGALRILSRIRTLGDDGLLRAVAGFFEDGGVLIISATELLPDVLPPAGHLAGPPLTLAQKQDMALGLEVAAHLGKADVGQTVVVKSGTVLAVEAVEGTDATLRRAGMLNGKGAVVVKRCKPGQDQRFDLPAVGERTLEVMSEAGLCALVLEAGRTVVLDPAAFIRRAEVLGISVECVEIV